MVVAVEERTTLTSPRDRSVNQVLAFNRHFDGEILAGFIDRGRGRVLKNALMTQNVRWSGDRGRSNRYKNNRLKYSTNSKDPSLIAHPNLGLTCHFVGITQINIEVEISSKIGYKKEGEYVYETLI